MRPIHRRLAAASLAVALAAPSMAAQDKSIVEVAQTAGSFNTLVTAIQQAGLVEALSGTGPFTVFAPTDEAFAKIPQDKLQAILADKQLLTSILTYHVVEGRLPAAKVVNSDYATTLNGQRVEITAAGGVKVDGANVIQTDIMASNGVIHVIDAVILPETRNIAEVAADAGKFTTLLTALTEAGLAETIATGGPFTVFAPTDEAFAKIPQDKLQAILADKELLTSILTYHVVEGAKYSDWVAKKRSVTALSGDRLSVMTNSYGVKVGGAKVVAADIEASNGVIHVIDEVLVP